MKKRYEISSLYRARSEYHHHDDFTYEDEWQLEIYLHALGLMKKHDLRSVLDVGCGSGYKLITYLGEYQTVGAELPANLERLRLRYPGRTWIASDVTSITNLSADVIICSDVLEHLTDPDEMLDYLKRLRYRFLVLSTPARNLLYRPWHAGFWGPPPNPAHQREWAFEEFGRYIRRHFDVVDHRVTNLRQATQMVICRS